MESKKMWWRRVAPYLIVYGIVLIPRILFCMHADTIRPISDEASTMSIAAKLAGYDWSAVTAQAGYYGIGTGALLSWAFKIFHSAIDVYRASLIALAITESLVAVICFYIMKEMFQIKEDWKNICVSVAVGYIFVTRATVYYNEHLLGFSAWLILLALLKLYQHEDSKKKCMLWTLLLTTVLGYSMTLHTRAMIFYAAVIGAVIVYALFYQKCLVNLPLFCVGSVGMGAVAKWLVKFYQKSTWTESNIRNASVSIDMTSHTNVGTVQRLEAWLDIILGQINMMTMISAGFLMVAFVVLICMCFKRIKVVFTQKTAIRDAAFERMVLLMGIFGFVWVGMSVLGMSVTWLGNAADIIASGSGGTANGARAFTYTRYVGPALGPIILMLSVILIQQEKEFKQYFYSSLKYIAIVHAYWLVFILKYCYEVKGCAMQFYPFSFNRTLTSGYEVFLPFTFIFIILIFIFTVLLKYKKGAYILPILALFIMYRYCYSTYYDDMAVQTQNKEDVNAIQTLYDSLDEKERKSLPKEIYVTDQRAIEDHQNYYIYQFIMYDRKILPTYPDEDVGEAILFTNKGDLQRNDIYKDYLEVQLDDNEYIWIKGEKLQKKLLPYIEKATESKTKIDFIGATSYDLPVNSDLTEISTTGKAGNLLTTGGLALLNGEEEVYCTLHLDNSKTEEMGQIQVVSEVDGRIMAEQKVLKSLFDKEGNAELKLRVSSYHLDSISIHIEAEEDTYWSVRDLSHRRVAIMNQLGQGEEREVTAIREMLDELDVPDEVYLMSAYEKGSFTVNWNKLEKMLGRKIIYLNTTDYEKDNYNKEQAILLINDTDYDWIFKLSHSHMVVGKTANYSLLVANTHTMNEKLESKGVEKLSGNQGVSVNYFNSDSTYALKQPQKEEFTLYQGTYEICVDFEGISSEKSELGCIKIKANNGKEIIYTFTKEEINNERVQYVIPWTVYEESNRMNYEVQLEYGTQLKQMNVYVQKLSDDIYVDLKEMNMADAHWTEQGIDITGHGGFNVYGPYLCLASGEYEAVMKYELLGDIEEGDIAVVDMGRNGIQMPNTQNVLNTAAFRNGKAEMVIPFHVINKQNLYEFRIVGNEGVKLRLKSIIIKRVG